MDPLACVSVPYVALQIIMRRYPDYREVSAVIVDELKPMGRILEVNRQARAHRILPGMRYAAGLSLDRNLRAAVVDESEVEAHLEELGKILGHFSPRFERAGESGVFWVCVKGLAPLFGGMKRWSEGLVHEIDEYGFIAASVVGFSRFHTYAMARSLRRGTWVFETHEDECQVVESLSLERVGLEPDVLSALTRLGIRSVGQFVRLPPSGVQERYGPLATRLHRLARGELSLPMTPLRFEEELETKIDFEDDEAEVTRLLFIIKRELRGLLLQLAARHQDLLELELVLCLRGGDTHEHQIRPARPTLDELRILELVRLRLENLVIPSGVVSVILRVEGVALRREQLGLFAGTRRDLEAASHALARIRAEFGEESVLELREGNSHVPEKGFELFPTSNVRLKVERPAEIHVELPANAGLVRRIQLRPEPLMRFERKPLEGWILRGLDAGPVVEAHGPFLVEAQWWTQKDEVAREYWLARTERGDVFWVYWDQSRGQWYLHGEAE